LSDRQQQRSGPDRPAQQNLERLIAGRREKLERLTEQGVEPYPYAYDRSHTSTEIRAQEQSLTTAETRVRYAGRIMAKRGTGKTLFVPIQDDAGQIQAYFRKDDLGVERFKQIQKLIDIGDWIGVEGSVFRTKSNELSIAVEDFTFLAKSIRPLPEKYHELSLEVRSRQRYLDLIMNQPTRERFRLRAAILAEVRAFFATEDFLEVETPVLQPLYGGATALPFTTHHNALDMRLYLRIADELYLKRLIIGGLEKVYEIAKDFRNEGMDRTHNPEFTMLECYAAYWDYHDMLDLTERLLRRLAERFGRAGQVPYGEQTLDFTQPFARVRFLDALAERLGCDPLALDDDALAELARKHDIETGPGKGRDKLLDELFGRLVEPTLIQPTFVLDHPQELSPLAKAHRSETGLVERFELFACGFELANAFSELNDAHEQRARFAAQQALQRAGDAEAQPLDEDFLQALEYGMPPTAGLGVGFDRVIMLLTDSHNIRDVLLFPHLRPEPHQEQPSDARGDQPE